MVLCGVTRCERCECCECCECCEDDVPITGGRHTDQCRGCPMSASLLPLLGPQLRQTAAAGVDDDGLHPTSFDLSSCFWPVTNHQPCASMRLTSSTSFPSSLRLYSCPRPLRGIGHTTPTTPYLTHSWHHSTQRQQRALAPLDTDPPAITPPPLTTSSSGKKRR